MKHSDDCNIFQLPAAYFLFSDLEQLQERKKK